MESDPHGVDPAVRVDQDRVEVRLLSLVLTGSFLNDLVEPIFYIATVHDSMIYRVACLTHTPWAVVAIFAAAALVALPHFVALLCMPRFLACRAPRKMACAAACAASLLWAYLGTLALPLDAGALPFLYWRACLGALVIAAVYGFSLNSQQLRILNEARQAG